MKSIFFFGATVLASAAAQGQNTATINQQGSSHDVSVTQQGSGNTSVISQQGGTHRAVISQSGRGNTATINQQGGATGDSTMAGQSVSVSQSGDGDTTIHQTDGSNSIFIHQSGTPATKPGKRTRNRTKPKNE